MLTIPPHLDSWYPNVPCDCFGTPAVLFRDHRLTLPLIDLGVRQGLLELPVTLVSFDRHRDSLAPLNGVGPLASHRASKGGQASLAGLVANHLSPRDDDWILAGMELGLIGDAVQFSSNPDIEKEPSVVTYMDASDGQHRIYQLGRPARELSFKGALADKDHPAVGDGLWEAIGWSTQPSPTHNPPHALVTDIDLDYWTIAWETHTFPFPREVFEEEWLAPSQSYGGDSISAAELLRQFIGKSSLLTIASEPQYCGCAGNAEYIMSMIGGPLFEGIFSGADQRIDYPQTYPSV